MMIKWWENDKDWATKYQQLILHGATLQHIINAATLQIIQSFIYRAGFLCGRLGHRFAVSCFFSLFFYGRSESTQPRWSHQTPLGLGFFFFCPFHSCARLTLSCARETWSQVTRLILFTPTFFFFFSEHAPLGLSVDIKQCFMAHCTVQAFITHTSV